MSTVQPRLCPQARRSTDADMRFIKAWLEAQENDEVHGTFLCNWNLTVEAHEAGKLLVYVDEQSQEVVAYQWEALVHPGILEVRNDMRGQGIGKALVAHRLAEAAEAGHDILRIQCTPRSSIPFWESMGFEVQKNGDVGMQNVYAFRLMPRTLVVPDEGERVQVIVEWYPEMRDWKPETPVERTQVIAGVREGGMIYLSERALCPNKVVGQDAVLRVTVDGEEWLCGKAKHERAADLGVEHCPNGFFLDFLWPEGLLAS